jgi:hypothetical protein
MMSAKMNPDTTNRDAGGSRKDRAAKRLVLVVLSGLLVGEICLAVRILLVPG